MTEITVIAHDELVGETLEALNKVGAKFVSMSPVRFDGYLQVDKKDLSKFPEPTIIDLNSRILHVKMKRLYPEDAIINGEQDDEENPQVPGYIKDDESVSWDIDIDTGNILNWKKGMTVKTNYKVCDEFEYDYDGFHYDGYVPDFMSLDSKGYGDYVYLTIDDNGNIKDWSKDKFIKEHSRLKEDEQDNDV